EDNFAARGAVDRRAPAEPAHVHDGRRSRRLLDGKDLLSVEHVQRDGLAKSRRQLLADRAGLASEVELAGNQPGQLLQAGAETVLGRADVTLDQPVALEGAEQAERR